MSIVLYDLSEKSDTVNNFISKLRNFMAGRNGVDKLTYGLIAVYCIVAAVRVISGLYLPIGIIQYAFLAFIIYRIMSRNLQKRYRENYKFEQFLKAWKPYFEHLKLRFRFIKTHRFRTCRHCGEFLRLKRGRGKRQIICPKCGSELTFYFLF